MNISRKITDLSRVKHFITQQFTETLNARQGSTKFVADNRDEIALQLVYLAELNITLCQLIITCLQCREQTRTFTITPLTALQTSNDQLAQSNIQLSQVN